MIKVVIMSEYPKLLEIDSGVGQHVLSTITNYLNQVSITFEIQANRLVLFLKNSLEFSKFANDIFNYVKEYCEIGDYSIYTGKSEQGYFYINIFDWDYASM